MVAPNIIEANVPGYEIDRIITQKLMPAIEEETLESAIIALLTMTLTLMKREITPEELVLGVRGMSEWACLHLSMNDCLEDGVTVKSDHRIN